MRDGFTTEVDLNEVLLGLLGALTDALRNFLSLTVTDADFTLLVTDDNECCEAEATTTLNDLRATVDVDDLFCEFWSFLLFRCRLERLLLSILILMWILIHMMSFLRTEDRLHGLRLQMILHNRGSDGRSGRIRRIRCQQP